MLLTSTCWWPFTARIALRFAALGWRVEAVCPPGHPLRATSAVARVHDYTALRPIAALRSAIAAAPPDLIVPCDDRSVGHLHALWAAAGADTPIARTIVRSLGRADSYAVATHRNDLIRIAREEGLRAPDMRAVPDADALGAAVADLGLPIVLKTDGTWGGSGVVVAHTQAQARSAFTALGRRFGPGVALKRLLVERDPFGLVPGLFQTPHVNAQRYVPGRPATCTVACQDGEVLASLHVEVLRADQELGPSNIVRVIDSPEMQNTAARLVRRLGVSGFCGFDFVVEDGTGHAHLVEMNPRSTQLCHLPLGPGRDLAAALATRLAGAPPSVAAPITHNPVIAFFPQAWRHAPDSPLLRTAYHDVPWEDPELMRELVQVPYADRGLLARLRARLWRARRHRRPAALASLGQL